MNTFSPLWPHHSYSFYFILAIESQLFMGIYFDLLILFSMYTYIKFTLYKLVDWSVWEKFSGHSYLISYQVVKSEKQSPDRCPSLGCIGACSCFVAEYPWLLLNPSFSWWRVWTVQFTSMFSILVTMATGMGNESTHLWRLLRSGRKENSTVQSYPHACEDVDVIFQLLTTRTRL